MHPSSPQPHPPPFITWWGGRIEGGIGRGSTVTASASHPYTHAHTHAQAHTHTHETRRRRHTCARYHSFVWFLFFIDVLFLFVWFIFVEDTLLQRRHSIPETRRRRRTCASCQYYRENITIDNTFYTRDKTASSHVRQLLLPTPAPDGEKKISEVSALVYLPNALSVESAT